MMKLAVMKMVCLVALLGGIVILSLTFNVQQIEEHYQRVEELLPKRMDGGLDLWLPGVIAGVLLVLVGGYGFLPQLHGRKSNTITYRGSHGDIILQLKPIRKVLLKVMRKMPEVYSIKLDVKPDADRRRACIIADVVLKNSAALGARRCAKMVADCLSATARDVLGLEDLSMVRVNVKGVHVDIVATGRQMREQLALREEEDAAAYALAHPPAASVTLDEESTDNRPAGIVDSQDEENVSIPSGQEVEDNTAETPESISESEDMDAVSEDKPPRLEEEVIEPGEKESAGETGNEDEQAPLALSEETSNSESDTGAIGLPPLLDKEENVYSPDVMEAYDASQEIEVEEEPEEVPEAQVIEESAPEENTDEQRSW